MDQATDLAGLEDLQRRFVGAIGRKDLDALMDCFWDSPELVVVLWGNVMRGAESLRASVARFFEENGAIELTVNEASSVPIGDGVMTVGTATYDLEPTAGPKTQIVEGWTDLARKIDGRWVYVLDQATVVPPPTE